jgi:1,4-dihydroxy-6-naphthoate synthase
MIARTRLTLGHSPDPDDAFMFWALAEGRVDSTPWQFEHILQDIQTLNERARRGELHVTAISIHAYAYVLDRYALLSSGSSMGDGYGPMVVARRGSGLAPGDLKRLTIAVPGTMTTAYLALRLMLGDVQFGVEPFDTIEQKVAAGQYDAGLIIHEGQLTYADKGLELVVDLGAWWKQETGLPLPLGGNAIRRDFTAGDMGRINAILRASIVEGLAHRDQAMRHALRWARDLQLSQADRFVGMYVNGYTLDYGDTGRRAVRELLQRGTAAGFIPQVGDLQFVG